MKHTTAINQNYLFRRLYKQGKCYVTPHMALYVKRNKLKINRLGITATKKIGNAVERNRARRLIMESYRLLEDELPIGFDFVAVARRKAVLVKMQEVQKGLRKAVKQILL